MFWNFLTFNIMTRWRVPEWRLHSQRGPCGNACSIKKYHTQSLRQITEQCVKDKVALTEEGMWMILHICLLLLSLYISAVFMDSSGSCQIQRRFKLNGMYQDGDFIIGGLFEVQYLKTFPVLSFRTEPELPQCEKWVWTTTTERTFLFHCLYAVTYNTWNTRNRTEII